MSSVDRSLVTVKQLAGVSHATFGESDAILMISTTPIPISHTRLIVTHRLIKYGIWEREVDSSLLPPNFPLLFINSITGNEVVKH